MASRSFSGFRYGGTQYGNTAGATPSGPSGRPSFPFVTTATAFATPAHYGAKPGASNYTNFGFGRAMPTTYKYPYETTGNLQQSKIHYSAPPTRNNPPPGRPSNNLNRERPKVLVTRPKQLHYCEVCKISCSCPRAYTEHLESKKHKRREAGLNAPAGSQTNSSQSKFHCKLCDVICTDKDAYGAHVRGSKHQKVVKLHTKLGKPIPEEEPAKPAKSDLKKDDSTGNDEACAPGTDASIAKDEDDAPEVKPVGAEYIEEIKEDGKVSIFNCKLCDCKFSDPNAKEMHTKGRRHRLQYKRKVEPDLVVDVKPTGRQKRLAQIQGDLWNMRRNPMDLGWPPRRPFSDFTLGPEGMTSRLHPNMRTIPGGVMPFVGWGGFSGVVPNMRPEGDNDFYVIARHSEIYPKEKVLHNIHEIVSNTERALRLVSDALAGLGKSSDTATDDTHKDEEELPASNNESDPDNSAANVSFQQSSDNGKVRVLQGGMRVGNLAKGLLLQGDNCVQLVVLCSEKPTHDLLERVASELTIQLRPFSSANKTYYVSVGIEDGSVSVTDGTIIVNVCLTSPLFRDEDTCPMETKSVGKDEELDFPREAAIKALAELRHSKWFQAKASILPSCVLVIRIMRDIYQRFTPWQALSQWAIELMVEKVVSTSRFPVAPAEILRRVMEAVSTGFLINGPGLLDPCEKEPQDVIRGLTRQQREDITRSAQTFLRLIAFKQIYKVLGMEQMSTSKLRWKFWLLNRKRACDDDTNEGETDGKLIKTAVA